MIKSIDLNNHRTDLLGMETSYQIINMNVDKLFEIIIIADE